jgi:hypothetical protein
MDTNLTPYAFGSEDGEALWFFGTLAIFKATAEQTGGRFSLEGVMNFSPYTVASGHGYSKTIPQ